MQVNVLEYFELGAMRVSPQATAIVSNGRPEFTYSELEQSAKRLASQILGRGFSRSLPIVVLLPKSADTVIADIGIIYSGNIYCNLDIKSPAPRLEKLIAQIRPCLLITSRELLDLTPALGMTAELIVQIEDAIDRRNTIDEVALRRRREQMIDADPLCIINTSGSTGIPKSAVMCHRSVIDFMDWALTRPEIQGQHIIGSLSPFYFDIYTLELWYCLAKGCPLNIIPDQYAAFPAKLVEYLTEQRVSFIFWVPTIMVTISGMNLLESADLSCLRTIFFAGEVFPMKHLNAWRRKLPHATFMNLYGPIEITVDCTYFLVDRDFEDDERLPIGFPCRNSDVLILNAENRPAAVNEQGELCVRGSSLAMGYWNDPGRTAMAFTQNPLNPAYPEIIYRTGDLVFRNERGEIMFLGRRDYQIKHLGYRIELGEIESVIVAIPGIANACVLYDAEAKEITLFYESTAALGAREIRAEASKLLPKYMVPTVLQRFDVLPRNPNAKIDRQRLQQTLARRKPS